jgi:hypothetical protein
MGGVYGKSAARVEKVDAAKQDRGPFICAWIF